MTKSLTQRLHEQASQRNKPRSTSLREKLAGLNTPTQKLQEPRIKIQPAQPRSIYNQPTLPPSIFQKPAKGTAKKILHSISTPFSVVALTLVLVSPLSNKKVLLNSINNIDNQSLGWALRKFDPESLPIKEKFKCAWRIAKTLPLIPRADDGTWIGRPQTESERDASRGETAKKYILYRVKLRLEGYVPSDYWIKRKLFEACDYTLKP